MNIYLFYNSLISDWNNGNAHFLRGMVSEFIRANHEVKVYEPRNGESLVNLIQDQGRFIVNEFFEYFPHQKSSFYDPDNFDPAEFLHDPGLVIVHERNDPQVVKRIGEFKARNPKFTLLFHDTNHRSVTQPSEIQRFDLSYYDGVLTFGDVIKNQYQKNSQVRNTWTWHEAADTDVFYPRPKTTMEGDLVWIGNWGDDERSEEIREFIIEPVKALQLKAVFYGVGYPSHALEWLENANIEYRGWIPNFKVPEVFSRFRMTVNVPRRPYLESLPGIPSIRIFEALACGIPLISSMWIDSEHLFRANEDFLMARTGEEMKELMKQVLDDPDFATQLVVNGLQTIQNRHTCSHRFKELRSIVNTMPPLSDSAVPLSDQHFNS